MYRRFQILFEKAPRVIYARFIGWYFGSGENEGGVLCQIINPYDMIRKSQEQAFRIGNISERKN